MLIEREYIEKLNVLVDELRISEVFQKLDELGISDSRFTKLKNDFIYGFKDSDFFDRLKAFINSLSTNEINNEISTNKEILVQTDGNFNNILQNLSNSNVNINTVINNINEEEDKKIKDAKQTLMGSYVKRQNNISFYQGIEKQVFSVLHNTGLSKDFILKYDLSLNTIFDDKIYEFNELYNYINNHIKSKKQNNQTPSQDIIQLENLLSESRSRMGLFDIEKYIDLLAKEKEEIIRQGKIDDRNGMLGVIGYVIQIFVTAYIYAPDMGWLKAIGFGCVAPIYWFYYTFLWQTVIQPLIN
jgi:hypothetical protein